MMTSAHYDTIIVGGGSAGCVVANRLSKDSNRSVLVLEAGRPDRWWDLFIQMPAALTYPIGSKYYDWCYVSEPEPFMNNRRITQGRGKILGGSSSINGMIFQRANPMDYQRWASDPGMENWDYAHCLPYFKRMENSLDKRDSQYRGTEGPLILETGPATNPLFQAFFEAVQQAGYSLTDDVNGYRQEGFGPFDRNIHKGKRVSASAAYLHPVKDRKNLTIQTRTLVTKVLFEGKKAIGVEVLRKNGSVEKISADEVILCGGAINSPQLLQLSGIGNAEELKELGIDVVHDLPGVGENLQDHLEVYVQYSCKKPVSVYPSLKWYVKPFIGLQWLLFKTGPVASNHFEGGGFLRSNDEVAYPNLMIHFLPVAIRYDGTSPGGGHGYQVHIGPMYSDARGSIKIKSADPTEPPAIRLNYLSTDQDQREWVEAIRAAREILNQQAFDPYNGGEISPGPSVVDDQEIMDWVGREGETAYHPSCTCKMGIDDMAVVDPETMSVHGVEGLRVVDSSVMPYVPNANNYAPTMMLAEKAADLILGKPQLKEDIDYYIHQSSS